MLNLKHDEQQQPQQKQRKLEKVYRGLRVTDAEIEELKLNVGRIISTNGFLSATPSSAIAKIYIQDEQEVLFDLGTIFRVLNVTYSDHRRLWIVSLITTADDDNDIQNKYITNRRYNEMLKIPVGKNIDQQLPYIFVSVLNEIGLYENAISFYEDSLQFNIINDAELNQKLYQDLGIAYLYVKKYDLAQKYTMNAYDLASEKHNTNDIAACLARLAIVHMKQGEHDSVLFYFEQAIQKSMTGQDGQGFCALLMCHYHMGEIYYDIDNYTYADKHYRRALKIYDIIKEKHFKKVLMLYDKFSSFSFDSNFGIIEINEEIGKLFHELGQYDSAIEYFSIALKLANDKTNKNVYLIARLYNVIGRCYQY
ncbi:unnamed protein product [Rotaria sp. Silwood2]|nr:unnamed protein product [Rotaria sp. Silwood2]CAF3873045.1 unnamed protein product [Rotaria sp. Silwood2]